MSIRALATYHAHVLAFSDIVGLVSNGLPDVTVDLYTTEAVGLNRLHHSTLTTHQRIGITHAVVLAFVEIAFGKGAHIDECQD